jgi:hypothetical protein
VYWVRAAGASDPSDPVIPLLCPPGRRESYESRSLHDDTDAAQINCDARPPAPTHCLAHAHCPCHLHAPTRHVLCELTIVRARRGHRNIAERRRHLVAPETAVAMATAPHRLWEGALELWLALARWSAPLCTLGAAPERCGDGGGARTRTRAGAGAVVGAGALEGAAPRSGGGAGAVRRRRRRRAHPHRGGRWGCDWRWRAGGRRSTLWGRRRSSVATTAAASACAPALGQALGLWLALAR